MKITGEAIKRKWSKFTGSVTNWPMWVAFIFILIIFGSINPRFFTVNNWWNILRQASPLALAATGQTIVLIAGYFDLSIGSITALASVVTVYSMWHFGTIAGIIIGLLVGCLAGLFNGFLVAKWKLNSFIVTLATAAIIRGIAMYVTDGIPLHGNILKSFYIIGCGHVGPVPIPVIIATIFLIGLHIFLTRTARGRHLFAIGGNREASRLVGLNLFNYTLLAFTLSGFFAAFAGVILTSRLGVGAPALGLDLALESIAAAVIGGVALGGGTGSALGVVLGLLLLTVISNGLNILRVSEFIQMIVTGVIIYLAVLVDRFKYKKLQD